MSHFKGPYLRVLTPRTTDGMNIKYDENLQVMYKESHFELSARASLEKENLTRPNQLRHIIETAGVVQTAEAQPFVARPQRIKRVNPQPGVTTPTPLQMVVPQVIHTQIVDNHEEEIEVKQPKKVKEVPKQKRHRRTKEEMQNA
jgi:hypothetical protein